MVEKSRAGKNVVSFLLLLLLSANLFHSHLHACDQTPPWAQKTVLKPIVEKAGSTTLPCLACNCQKLKIAVLSVQALLAKLVQTDYSSGEPSQTFNKQHFLPIDLSRAPPQLG